MGCSKDSNCNPCNDECDQPCDEGCGCGVELSAECIRIANNYECLDIDKGETLEQAIARIDAIACDFSNPSDGENGTSAYQLWLDLGNEGTEQEFIDSLNGTNGTDCECTEGVFYVEIPKIELAEIGSWADFTSIASATPIAVPTTNYTVPVGGAGDYEIQLQTNGALGQAGADGENCFYVDAVINGVLLPNAISVSHIPSKKIPWISMSLFVSNIALIEGDVIGIRVASKAVEQIPSFIYTKYKLTKLA